MKYFWFSIEDKFVVGCNVEYDGGFIVNYFFFVVISCLFFYKCGTEVDVYGWRKEKKEMIKNIILQKKNIA